LGFGAGLDVFQIPAQQQAVNVSSNYGQTNNKTKGGEPEKPKIK
jgi:hypothetical protein